MSADIFCARRTLAAAMVPPAVSRYRAALAEDGIVMLGIETLGTVTFNAPTLDAARDASDLDRARASEGEDIAGWLPFLGVPDDA